MSRSGYNDDGEYIALWRGQVASALRGRRGQTLLRDLVTALDAMAKKRLIVGNLQNPDGAVCALGAVGVARKIDMADIDPHEPQQVAKQFNIAHQLAAEIVYMNDEYFDGRSVEKPNGADLPRGHARWEWIKYTPEERWTLMRDWAASNLAKDEQQPPP